MNTLTRKRVYADPESRTAVATLTVAQARKRATAEGGKGAWPLFANSDGHLRTLTPEGVVAYPRNPREAEGETVGAKLRYVGFTAPFAARKVRREFVAAKVAERQAAKPKASTRKAKSAPKPKASSKSTTPTPEERLARLEASVAALVEALS